VSAREGTPLPSRPVRFALEAGFIILVGVIAAVLDLTAIAIVIVMGLAWVVVMVVERAAKSAAVRPRRARERAAPPVATAAAEEPPEPLLENEAGPEPRRRLRFSEPRSAAGSTDATREWNLWELERRARAHAGADAVPEEWAAIFMHLREFANSDGRLPAQFDSLVRESFPELTRAG
jgi:hypothetical protein